MLKKKIIHFLLIFFLVLQGSYFGLFFTIQTFAVSPFTFTVTTNNNWGTGFCYEFTTQNTSAAPVSDWVIGFELNGGTINNSYGGAYTQSGGSYEIRTPGAYADPLAVGSSITMGFCGNGTGSAVVSSLELKSYAGSSGGVISPGSTLEEYHTSFQNLQLDVVSSSQYVGGYCRNISITNTGQNIINGWSLNFKLDQVLSSSYSGNFTRNGVQHTITPVGYNTDINPGVSYVLGFCTNGTKYDYDWIIGVNGQTSPSIGTSNNQIGTGYVMGSGAFNSSINWNGYFPGTATGTITNIAINARVNPSLNLMISAAEINLGTLVSGVTSTGSIFLEVGTNAKSGVSITAKSQNGGLVNTSDTNTKISSVTSATDTIAESYRFSSVAKTGTASDSSYGAFFTAIGLTELEIVNNFTEHTIYNSNKSEAMNLTDDVQFLVSAQSVAETPGGDYEDRITFTVTGNF